MATETVTLRLVAQDLMSGNVSKAIASIDKLAKKGGIVGSVLQGVGQSMGQMLNPVALVANGIGMVTSVMGDSIKAASDQAEALSKVSVVFGDQAKEIEDWSNAAAGSMGLTRTAALEAAGTLGSLFDGLGLAQDASTEMSKSIVQLAADLGSFNNVASEDALLALRSGLLGEAEPMRKFGSALSAARVEAYGLANGLGEMVKVGKATKFVMSEADKVTARYQLILKDTKNAQGDYARTADGMANSQKTITASFEDMQVQIGKTLKDGIMPFLAFMVDVVNQSPNTANAVGKTTQKMRDMIEAQKDQMVTSQQQIGLFDWIGREIYGIVAPQDKAITQFTDQNMELVRSLGVTRKEFALFVEAGLTLGKSLDEIRTVAVGLVAETIDLPKMAMRYVGAVKDMVGASEGAGRSIYGGLVRPVRQAFRAMFATMDSQKQPWKEAWKSMATWAKDPFRPKAFEKWLEKRAEKAVEKGREAAEKGKFPVAQRWFALAAVMRKPVLAALADTEADIQKLVDALILIQTTSARTGTGRMGSEAKVAGRASGGPVTRGQAYVVGEHEPELFVPNTNGTILNGRQMAGLSPATTIVTNVTYIGSLSEADGDRLASVIEKPLRRRMARAGA